MSPMTDIFALYIVDVYAKQMCAFSDLYIFYFLNFILYLLNYF